MNIHEYQAKELFEEFGVPVQSGVAAKSEAEFDAAIAAIKGDHVVVKSQIHAGGRGKGVFVDGFKGGVKFVPREEAAATAIANGFPAAMRRKNIPPSDVKCTCNSQ